ncbi:MAG: NADH-quinone oxidoreductase subunit B, partial [Chloroflexi bacterium]|nr:NADH-quinone oxidoreductase subunit B [Chloroflexota bacterium]
VYIPGCPPTPQALLHGLITLQNKIDKEKIRSVRWYQRGPSEPIPVPVLGPDLMDPRQYARIRAHTQEMAQEKAATETDETGVQP